MHKSFWVEKVHHRVGVQRERGGKHDNLVPLANFFQKLIDARSLLDVNHMRLPLHLQRNLEIGVGNRGETAMHKGFVEIQDEASAALDGGGDGRQERGIGLIGGLALSYLLQKIDGINRLNGDTIRHKAGGEEAEDVLLAGGWGGLAVLRGSRGAGLRGAGR